MNTRYHQAAEIPWQPAGIVVQASSELDGVSVYFALRVSSEALQRELQAGLQPAQSAHIPAELRQAMQDRAQLEVQAMLDEARPSLLAYLVLAAYAHQSNLNKNDILPLVKGGAA